MEGTPLTGIRKINTKELENLFVYACKLKGLAVLFRDHNPENFLENSGEGYYGISEILNDISEDLRRIHFEIS